MKIGVFSTLLFFMTACAHSGLRLPAEPAIYDLASPVRLQTDTTQIDLNDYLLSPEKIQKISVSEGWMVTGITGSSLVKILAADSLQCAGNLRIRYKKYDYDIPMFDCRKSNDFSIFTEKYVDDTVYVRTSGPGVEWMVYLDNYKLGPELLLTNGDCLGILIPAQAKSFRRTHLRVWATDGKRISGDILIPLDHGQVIADAARLDCFDKQNSALYLLMPVRNSDTSEKDNLPLSSAGLRVYDDAMAVFALPGEKFCRLHGSLQKSFRQDGVHDRRVYLSGHRDQARFMAYAAGDLKMNEEAKAMEGSHRVEGYQPSDPAAYDKLLQFLTFQATIPGIPVICGEDEIGGTDGKDPMQFDSLCYKGKTVCARIAALHQLRRRHMALVYGDFIPLRVEEKVYVYARSYFGQTVVVAFNKGKENVTLKLDLPAVERNADFHALFDGRFSYNNSRLILDIPPDGVEVIYNGWSDSRIKESGS